MFGIIYALIGIIGKIGWINKQANANKESFKRTYNPILGTYKDMYMAERKPNGEYCKTQIDPFTGDLVQIDSKNKIVRNFSKEKRINEANNCDNTVIKLSEIDMTGSPYVDVKGIRYIDKETNEEYVIREFVVSNNYKSGGVYFYMRTSDMSLVRITDGEKKYGYFKDMNAINNFILNYNKQQKITRFYNIKEKCHNNEKRDCDRRM